MCYRAGNNLISKSDYSCFISSITPFQCNGNVCYQASGECTCFKKGGTA
jgi:hypothetical protein